MMVLVKKHRHIRLLGQIDGNHKHVMPREFYGETEFLPLLTKALEGDISGLVKILNSKERDRMHSFLNNRKFNQE